LLLVTAHVKVCHLAYGDVCFVNLFRSILPVVPTECDVLIVCWQHNDKEWKFKEQHAKMWENIAGAKRYSRPRGFNIAGASAPVAPAVPTPLSLVAGFCRRGVGHFTSAASPVSLFIVYTVQ